MSNSIDHKISSWKEFQSVWDGVHNFALGEECVPFSYPFPSLEKVVEELRQDEMVKVRPGVPDTKLRTEEMAHTFRQMRLDRALDSNFGIAHFSLSRFDRPGKFLHGFEENVLHPWKEALRAADFTWERCYPICFVSGKGCATNYHMDFSHVLAWQIHGSKRFCGLRDPERWADRETRLNYDPAKNEKPKSLSEEDAECFLMEPGAVLWNTFLTPHWVEAGDSVAMSINISHGGLRWKGRLCPHEEELVAHRATHPKSAPKVQGSY